ncbi:MAG: metallophosphoesterase [Methanobrevibacter sp.]|nr:metallophosphoesterase [Methanobrevibacter sp.]
MTYFVISDIHGFYKEMIRDLHKAGFRKNNPDHILIVLGDIFDRGPGNVEVYKFLYGLPKSRRILIRGNHDYLLCEAVERGFFNSYDYSNGTVDTVSQFIAHYYPAASHDNTSLMLSLFANLGIVQWILGNDWINFYELDDYIFVHSWIPVIAEDPQWIYHTYMYDCLQYDENWETASNSAWIRASWGCPWLLRKHNLLPPDRTIVCGHWHTSAFRVGLDGEDKDCNDMTIYYGDRIIGLDACTVKSGFCNVLKIEHE